MFRYIIRKYNSKMLFGNLVKMHKGQTRIKRAKKFYKENEKVVIGYNEIDLLLRMSLIYRLVFHVMLHVHFNSSKN